MENHNEAPSLDIINDLEYGVWKATALRAALELDVFTVIARGQSDLERIAAATNCSERGMRILLDALCPLGLLSKSHNEYFLTPPSEAFLVCDNPTYYGDWCLKTRIAWDIRGVTVTVHVHGREHCLHFFRVRNPSGRRGIHKCY
ncbi:MAG: hypothetical protein HXS44_11185 [Theionarchaea archaeon]|nr:hypothetical protein [Theionarchaea archaeon]